MAMDAPNDNFISSQIIDKWNNCLKALNLVNNIITVQRIRLHLNKLDTNVEEYFK